MQENIDSSPTKRIEILDNGNNRIYQEIAILIDKPLFLDHITKIRSEYIIYKGGNPPRDRIYSSYPKDKSGKVDLAKYARLEELKKLLPQEYDNLIHTSQSPSIINRLHAEAVFICFEFGRPFYLVPIVLQSFIYDAVNSAYLQRSSATIFDYYSVMSTPEDDLLPTVMIEVSPYTTETDIKRALQDSKHLFATDHRLKYIGEIPHFKKKIRSYRSWYWEYLSCKSYVKIANTWANNPLSYEDRSGFDENDVNKGINIYEDLLKL